MDMGSAEMRRPSVELLSEKVLGMAKEEVPAEVGKVEGRASCCNA